jgi:hypothetical protein
VGLQIQVDKALINNDIEAFIFNITGT